MSSAKSASSAEVKRNLRSKKNYRGSLLRSLTEGGGYRPMHRFSPSQREKLLRLFAVNRYPSTDVKRSLAEEFHVSIHRISCWFNEKRRARNNFIGLHGTDKAYPPPSANKYSTASSPASSTNTSSSKKFSSSKQLLTKRQLDRLAMTFEKKKYISAAEQAVLCEELNLSESQITNWFVHRRHRLRKSALGIGAHLGERELFARFSPIQLTEFLHYYNKAGLPSFAECSKLASELQVSTKRVMSWFHKREKSGKMHFPVDPQISGSFGLSSDDEMPYACSVDSCANSSYLELTDEQVEAIDNFVEQEENPISENSIRNLCWGLDAPENVVRNYLQEKFGVTLEDSINDGTSITSDSDDADDPIDLNMQLDAVALNRLAKAFCVDEDWMETWFMRSAAYCREKRALFA
ncbi:Homeobox domain containing protein [Trichuris trichiura]|uniref:Homeobox domain containing protein n=1 Tax=Trichuris trichiura TaxID=36087 RepID=A0A077Z4W5_TRITR|nr:Homeobox domain containing protein [Trichuris trichiura]